MGLNFEMFEGARGSYEPRISIRSNGTIGLSQGALNRFNIRDGDWVVQLYYDRNAKVIGIKPIPDDSNLDPSLKGTIKLIKREITGPDGKGSVNCFVSAKSFLDFYDIPYGKTKTYNGQWYTEGNMILLYLDQPEVSDKPKPKEEDTMV